MRRLLPLALSAACVAASGSLASESPAPSPAADAQPAGLVEQTINGSISGTTSTSTPFVGTPETIRIGPPALLTGPLTVQLDAASVWTARDTPGIRRLLVGQSGAVAQPAVTLTPGAASDRALGAADRVTTVEAGVQRPSDAPQLGDATHAAIAWLLARSERLTTEAGAPSQEAGAIQVAIWKLIGSVKDAQPTSDAAINARADELRTLATGHALPANLVLAGPATACLDEPARIGVSGPPGAAVRVVITGRATLLGTAPTLDANGGGTVVIRASRLGPVTVAADADGSELVLANTNLPSGAGEPPILKPSGATVLDAETVLEPETVPSSRPSAEPRLRMFSLRTVVVSGSINLNATDCSIGSASPDSSPGTGRGGPAPAAGVAAARVARTLTADESQLDVSAAARRSRSVRITVDEPVTTQLSRDRRQVSVRISNRGRAAASRVVVTTRLSGRLKVLSVVGGRALGGGALRWELSGLAPGATRTVRAIISSAKTGVAPSVPRQRRLGDPDPPSRRDRGA